MELNLHLEELKKVQDYTDPHDPERDLLFLVATLLDPTCTYKLLTKPSQIESTKKELLWQLKDLPYSRKLLQKF